MYEFSLVFNDFSEKSSSLLKVKLQRNDVQEIGTLCVKTRAGQQAQISRNWFQQYRRW